MSRIVGILEDQITRELTVEMYYHEVLYDGTELGLFDGTQPQKEMSEQQFFQYHEEVAARHHPDNRGHRLPKADSSEAPFEAARARTALISTYRVHPVEYYSGGLAFPDMWKPFPGRLDAHQRFSPPGTLGYYFGLTVAAAMNEGKHYFGENVASDQSNLLLVHRTYYEDILYLAPVLWQVWEHLGLPQMPIWQMFLRVMDPDTSNEYTNQIGTWAREYGYKGIVFPSARYEDWNSEEPLASQFPILNFTPIGSLLCENSFAASQVMLMMAQGIADTIVDNPPRLVSSEPNLVIFDESMIAGHDRPVFYNTYFIHEADMVESLDERKGSFAQIQYGLSDDEIIFTLLTPSDSWLFQVPRCKSSDGE